MKLILYDINKQLCEEWRKHFKDFIKSGEVKVLNIEFKDLKAEFVVTAGNSYGFMTGGIDLAVRDYYGQSIQDRIQETILHLSGRHLPVGDSLLINTNDFKKPNLIYVPTMQVPQPIDSLDVFYVFARLLKEYDNFACCGLGTATGGVSEEDCAKAMYKAYCYIKEKQNS